MPIKKIETVEISKEDPRNRTRGKGKIKIVKRQHVNNEELSKELVAYKESERKHGKGKGIATERLGEIFIDLVDNFATKSNFSGYSFLEEMKSRAIYFLLRYSLSFNPKKSNNAFAYCTQIVKNAFIQVIKKENKHIETKKNYIEKFFREVDYSKKDDELMS